MSKNIDKRICLNFYLVFSHLRKKQNPQDAVDKIVIAMNRDKVKEALKQVLEQDDSLKYALATNLVKYGRPQSKKSDKPAKLTKSLEKGREKYVKDLKKSMSEGMDDEKAVQAIAAAVSEFANIPNDRFLQGIIRTALGSGYVNEGWNDNEVKVNLSDLSWDIVTSIFPDIKPGMGGVGFPLPSDASRMVGSKNDLESWKGDIMKRYGDVEVKIDSTASAPWDKVKVLDDKFISDKEQYIGGKAAFLDKERQAGRTTGLDEEEKKKADRCLRIARRKIPQSSAYRSGLIVKCRKGMIWKREK